MDRAGLGGGAFIEEVVSALGLFRFGRARTKA